jgi:hypothetical protein
MGFTSHHVTPATPTRWLVGRPASAGRRTERSRRARQPKRGERGDEDPLVVEASTYVDNDTFIDFLITDGMYTQGKPLRVRASDVQQIREIS